MRWTLQMRGAWWRAMTAGAAALSLSLAWHWADATAHTRRISPPSNTIAPIQAARPLQGVIIVVDPGHGGEDPGAVSAYGTEASYTYRAAAEIGAALKAQGATVHYTVQSRALGPDLAATEIPLTPPTDAKLAVNGEPIRVRHSPKLLWQRVAVARHVWDTYAGPNRAHSIFFLSLHMDDASDPDIHGSLVCIDRRRPPPAFGLALARALARDSLARTERSGSDMPGLSMRSLGVLNPQYNPIPQSALLEMTTLSNFDDALHAADPRWRAQMAARIIQAILVARQSQ